MESMLFVPLPSNISNGRSYTLFPEKGDQNVFFNIFYKIRAILMKFCG